MKIRHMKTPVTHKFFFALLFFAPHLSNGQEIEYQGVDVYGTEVFDAAYVEREFASELRLLAEAVATMDRATEERLSAAIADELKQLADFAYLDVVGVIPDGYISVDVVERGQEDRMPFREAPRSRYEDPDGLLAKWREYFDKEISLSIAGELQGYSEPCEVLHCVVPFAPNPELLPYLEVLNEGVSAHEDILYEIAENGADPHDRESAIFLLGHSQDLNRLLPFLRHAIYDPHWGVRNNAMRMRIWIWMTHPELPFPVEDFIAAMDFPSPADRNKTTFMLAELAAVPEYREVIFERAVPNALKILRLRRPANYLGAYELLKAVSEEDFGEQNYVAWEEWYESQSSGVR
jgi:hypothetical protein